MISPISFVSVTRGTLVSVTRSDVSKAAAISGSAAFFEPLTQMSPASWAPPVIFRIWSEAEPLAAACPRQPKARLRYREGLVELDLLRRREGAGQPLLRALASGLGLLEGDLVRVLGHVGEHCDPVGQDLEKAATDEEQLFLTAVRDLQGGRLEDRHQRSIPRQHPELAIGAVGDDEVDIALEQAALDAHDPEGYWQLALASLLHLFALRPGLVDGSDHVEGLLGQVVVLAFENLLESAHRLLHRNGFALPAGEALRNVEGLGEKALHLARPADRQLVVLRQLLHAEDGDDVLQVLVALHGLLHALGRVVVLLPDDRRLDVPA